VAPAEPYRPDRAAPWRRGDAPLVELPIAVSPLLRAPAIGTALTLSPEPLRRGLVAAMARRPLFNLELHGLDLVDAEDDGIPGALVARQPDLRIALARKRASLASVLDHVLQRFSVTRLDLAAAQFATRV